MISGLSTEKFYDQLNSNVQPGSPWIMGSPLAVFTLLDNKSKFFYGKHGQSKFELTRNAGMLDLTEFVIKGTYKSSPDKMGTQVDYKLEPIPFGYYWIRLMPPLFLIVISIILLINTGTEILISLLMMWVSIGIPWFIILWRSKILKRDLEQKFKEYLGIIDR